MNDIVLNKLQIIKRCLQRIDEEYAGTPVNLENFTKQDSIVLNIQRACEASIDLAMHMIAENNWGIPQNSRDAFEIICKHGVINAELLESLQAMVGFRNRAVHNYQILQLNILRDIVEKHLTDFVRFSDAILQYTSKENQ